MSTTYSIKSLLDNQYVSGTLIVFLIVYASMIAPKLPERILKLFDHILVKLVMLFLIVYLMKKNVTVALVASIALVVTVIALDNLNFTIKFNNEMMEIVGSNISSESDNLSGCNCKTLNDIQPTTEEGYLVMSEIKQAVENGELNPNFAHFLGHDVLKCETENIPVLMSKTEEGQIKMDEITKAEDTGVINTEEAKILAAKVVVNEAVAIQTNTNSIKTERMTSISLLNSPTITNVPSEMPNLTPFVESVESVESVELVRPSLATPTITAPSKEVHPVVQEMVKDVLKIKEDETMRRGGVAPSPEEIISICASVLNDYKKSPKCGTDCAKQSESVSEDYNVIAVDYDESTYSFLE